MRILIVSTFFPPLNSIASLRPYSWAKQWSQMNHEVTVLTTKKNHQVSINLKNYSQENYEVIEVDTFFQRLKASKSYKKKLSSSRKKTIKQLINHLIEKIRHRYGILNACRMPDFTDFWILPALRAVKSKKPWDVIVSTAGPYSVHLVAYLLKKKSMARAWIADYRDGWSNNHIYPGIFPFNKIENLLEKHLLKKANLITTVSDPLKELLVNKHKTTSIHTVYNGFDPEDFKSIQSEFAFTDRDKFRIVYTGSLYLDYQNPSPLFEAIRELSREENFETNLNQLEVIFVGPNQGNLKSLISRYEVEKWVKIQGFVPRNVALAMQRDAHYLLFFPWNNSKIDGVLTGKIFEYLYSKTAIISIGCEFMEASQRLMIETNAGESLPTVSQIKIFLKKELNSLIKKTSKVDPIKLQCYDRLFIAKKFYSLIEACINEKK